MTRKRNQHVVPTKDEVKHVSARSVRAILELPAAHRAELLKEWQRSQADE